VRKGRYRRYDRAACKGRDWFRGNPRRQLILFSFFFIFLLFFFIFLFLFFFFLFFFFLSLSLLLLLLLLCVVELAALLYFRSLEDCISSGLPSP
jgi:hypothetical protein